MILAYEPTQGVDVGSRFDIYEALRTRTDAGAALLVKSSDPLELSGLCDRVLVMSRGQIIEEIPGDELDELRIVEAIVRGPGLSKAGRSPLGMAMPKTPFLARADVSTARLDAAQARRPQGHPRRPRQEQVAQDRQVPPVDAGGAADPADRGAALVHQLAVPRVRQPTQRHADPHPGAAADRGGDRRRPMHSSSAISTSRSAAMVSLGVVVASFLIGAESPPSRDPDRGRGHPPLRPRPRPGQRRPDPRTQDPVDHRHPGHAQHPRTGSR